MVDGVLMNGLFCFCLHQHLKLYSDSRFDLYGVCLQVNDLEWSFGFCENGSGVFSCQPKANPMYKYRESVPLGTTELSRSEIERILIVLRRDWPGASYDLLSRNCNHFCEEFCLKLGVEKLPCMY